MICVKTKELPKIRNVCKNFTSLNKNHFLPLSNC